ncbi:hypothetical protein Trydic_g13380 [Trypoxylus dichotomus]
MLHNDILIDIVMKVLVDDLSDYDCEYDSIGIGDESSYVADSDSSWGGRDVDEERGIDIVEFPIFRRTPSPPPPSSESEDEELPLLPAVGRVCDDADYEELLMQVDETAVSDEAMWLPISLMTTRDLGT